MEINDIKISQIYTGSFESMAIDGEQHKKALPLLSVVQATEGEYDIRIDRQKLYKTGAGGIFIAPSKVMQTITHHAAPESGRMTARWVFIDARINGSFAFDSVFSLPVLMPEDKKQAASLILDDIFRDNDPCERMIGGYRLMKLLIEAASPKKPEMDTGFYIIEQYISRNYREKITVAELSELLHMSESNFYLIFKKHYGVSPIAYVNDYRLSVASLLMHNPENSIRDAAEQAGFCDQFYFSKYFKKKFLVTPRRYRESVGLSRKA